MRSFNRHLLEPTVARPEQVAGSRTWALSSGFQLGSETGDSREQVVTTPPPEGPGTAPNQIPRTQLQTPWLPVLPPGPDLLAAAAGSGAGVGGPGPRPAWEGGLTDPPLWPSLGSGTKPPRASESLSFAPFS